LSNKAFEKGQNLPGLYRRTARAASWQRVEEGCLLFRGEDYVRNGLVLFVGEMRRLVPWLDLWTEDHGEVFGVARLDYGLDRVVDGVEHLFGDLGIVRRLDLDCSLCVCRTRTDVVKNYG
jgi:hypothetical protein